MLGLSTARRVQHDCQHHKTVSVKMHKSIRRIHLRSHPAPDPATPPPPMGPWPNMRQCCRSARDFGTIRTSPPSNRPDRRYKAVSTPVSRPAWGAFPQSALSEPARGADLALAVVAGVFDALPGDGAA